MGEVAIRVKVSPESPEIDLEPLEEKVRDQFPVKDVQEEAIGFGLSALKFLIVRDEDEGGTDDIENELEKVEGVASVEVEDVTLL
ncbi:MAG: elongation factor 1-beta [Candidatus Aenigmatarchaeota archaeon]